MAGAVLASACPPLRRIPDRNQLNDGGSMSLKEKINSEMVAAAKAKDSIKLGAIRMIKTSLHNKEIDARRELKEEEILQVLGSLVKQRRDSIEQFKAGNRQDRAVTARGKALSGRKKRRIKPLHIPDLPYIRDEALKKGAES